MLMRSRPDGEVMAPPSDASTLITKAMQRIMLSLTWALGSRFGLADASQEAVSDADVGPSMDAGTEVEVDSAA